MLDKKRGPNSLVLQVLLPSICSLLGVCEKHCLQRKMQNVNEFHERTVTAAECVTNEVLSSAWQETEYCLEVCHATNGAQTEF
jgi:hypothetical protein